jgi:chemotaxis protein MotB
MSSPSQRGGPGRPYEEEEGGQEWLTTYADMVTLLLTFFVMLVAISSVETERFEKIMMSIQYTLGSGVAPGGRVGRIDVHDVRRRSLATPTGAEDEPLLEDIRESIKRKDLQDSVQVVQEGHKVVIRVKGQVLFPSGSSAFEPSARKVLEEIARIVQNHPEYRLDVGGHTDPRPISTTKFETNWELSALRATAVLRYLVEQGVNPRRLTATGYADTDPLVPNTSLENMAKNRRVEFVLEKEKR